MGKVVMEYEPTSFDDDGGNSLRMLIAVMILQRESNAVG